MSQSPGRSARAFPSSIIICINAQGCQVSLGILGKHCGLESTTIMQNDAQVVRRAPGVAGHHMGVGEDETGRVPDRSRSNTTVAVLNLHQAPPNPVNHG